MKTISFPKLLCLLLATAAMLTAAASAADHWFQITILAGDSTLEFTGSSAMESAQLAKGVTGTELIVLENLREFASPEENAPEAWHEVASAKRVFIVPKTVIFFHELSGDPMAENPAPAPGAAAPAAPAPAPETPAKDAGKAAPKGKKK